MYVIAPREEATGEACLSLAEAQKTVAKLEAQNRLRPNAQNALNLACIYYTLGRGTEALHAADLVVDGLASLNGEVPGHIKATAIFNRGMFHRGFGNIGQAQADIKWAWALDKTNAYIGMARAEEYLRNGQWDKGWELHNRVRGTCGGAALACGLPESCKFWDGCERPSHLLVINEGGAGDRINYTRYLPALTERGISWSFFCFDEFAPFYERLPWIGKTRLIRETEKREFSPPPSHWTTTFALPGPLQADPTRIPPYPSPFTAPEHNFRFDKQDGLPVVGLSWSANELFQGGLKVRSLTEGQAMRLVCMTGDKVHWVNLQHQHKMPFPVVNVPFDTWQDTAVLMEALDAVVTVDSGPLWLSVAMGKPTAGILTSCEDWKFQADWGSELKLYRNGPSASLFDAEKALDALISDIRQDQWPIR